MAVAVTLPGISTMPVPSAGIGTAGMPSSVLPTNPNEFGATMSITTREG
jgi:hypothetical protein